MKIVWLFVFMIFFLQAKDYTKHPQTIKCMNTLMKKYDFKRDELEKLFSNVNVQKTALRAFIPRKKQRKIKETRTPAKIKDRCKAEKVGLFFKGWDGVNMKKIGRELDGKYYDEIAEIFSSKLNA